MSWSFSHEGSWNDVMERITRSSIDNQLQNYKTLGERDTAVQHFENYKKACQTEMQSIHDEMMQKTDGAKGVRWSMFGHWDQNSRSGQMKVERYALPADKKEAKAE